MSGGTPDQQNLLKCRNDSNGNGICAKLSGSDTYTPINNNLGKQMQIYKYNFKYDPNGKAVGSSTSSKNKSVPVDCPVEWLVRAVVDTSAPNENDAAFMTSAEGYICNVEQVIKSGRNIYPAVYFKDYQCPRMGDSNDHGSKPQKLNYYFYGLILVLFWVITCYFYFKKK